MKSKIILVFLSISFVVLGALELVGLVKLTSIAFFGFSMAAFLFVISDTIDKINDNVGKIKMVRLYQFIIMLFAIMSIIVIPFIKYSNAFEGMKYALLLFTIGMLFVVIASDEIFSVFKKNQKNKYDEIAFYNDLEMSKISRNDINSITFKTDKAVKEESLKNDFNEDEEGNKRNHDSTVNKKRFTLYDKIKKDKFNKNE